jgi:threonine aldolase
VRSFASDNYAPAHPEVLAALSAINQGHQRAYGADEVTSQLEERFRELFGPNTKSYLVWNGTGANVLALYSLLKPWEAVICTKWSHINVDEGGAPERIIGVKLIDLPTNNAKLTPEQIDAAFIRTGDEHYAQPRIVSITQSTEYGTIYSVDEIAAIAEITHKNHAYLHLDGARISNAAVALQKSFREFTTDVGVDVVSFGGTKNGLINGEAVLYLNPDLGEKVKHLRKSLMQLNSKMRYTAVQLLTLLSDDLWYRSAAHANQMAQLLASEVSKLPGIKITQPVEVNSVFAIVPKSVSEKVPNVFPFYVWQEHSNEVRWMCAWDTTEQDVANFVAAIKSAL